MVSVSTAHRLEVSERTLRRDVDSLRDLGYPIESRRGVAGGYQLAAGATLPPLLLGDDEAITIVVGLHTAVNSAVAGVAEPSIAALAKVVQVLPARLRKRAEALGAMTSSVAWSDAAAVEPETLATVALACRNAEQLQFRYTAREGKRTKRLVEPHRIVLVGRRWYLVAFDLDRWDWRSFRIDRIANAHSTAKRCAARTLPARDAASFVQSSLDEAWPRFDVVAIVHAAAPSIKQRIGRKGGVEPVDTDRCVVTMRAESLDWPLFVLGGLGAELAIVSPPELAELASVWSKRLANAAITSRDG